MSKQKKKKRTRSCFANLEELIAAYELSRNKLDEIDLLEWTT